MVNQEENLQSQAIQNANRLDTGRHFAEARLGWPTIYQAKKQGSRANKMVISLVKQKPMLMIHEEIYVNIIASAFTLKFLSSSFLSYFFFRKKYKDRLLFSYCIKPIKSLVPYQSDTTLEMGQFHGLEMSERGPYQSNWHSPFGGLIPLFSHHIFSCISWCTVSWHCQFRWHIYCSFFWREQCVWSWTIYRLTTGACIKKVRNCSQIMEWKTGWSSNVRFMRHN